MTLPQVSVWTLAREEIRALPRTAFGLGAIAVVFGLFVPIGAMLYGGEGDVDDVLIFTWLVAELVVAIVLAARVAAARQSRFVESLYTTPLDQPTWFAAQAIVGVVLALLVLLAQVPFLLVILAFVGVPAALPPLLVSALGISAFAVALGLFCGVIVGESGPGAAAGIAGGVGFLSFMLFLFQGLALSEPPSPMQDWLIRVTSLSPISLVAAGTGVDLFNVVAIEWWRPTLGFVALVGGLFGAAWWSYTRAQGPLGWDARGGRAIVVALVALAVLTPVASAAVEFEEIEDPIGFPYDPGEHTQVAFVARGAPLGDETFTLYEILGAPDLPRGEDVEVDVLVLLMVPDGTTVRGVRIELEGSDVVRVISGGSLSVPDGTPSGRAPPGEGWESVSKLAPRPVYRVPAVLRALSVEAIANSPSPVTIRTDFVADGRALHSEARMLLDGEVPGGQPLLALAGAPLPLAAAAALVSRKIRTR
ncbi:MAG TPA: hypothetical protein VM370_09685 [Candidatus Thermoplasmatota archaeon]|nr:hypothetical protein [Candidatus Thermoplasmatota archaeon]